MNTSTVERALRRVGELLDYHTDVEILLVGSAAGIVTGVLAPSRLTADCDVMVYMPPDSMSSVEIAAERVADELELPPNWFNSDVSIRIDALPDGWERRKVLIGMFGRLRVYAASRSDLIAMKVLSGRDQDIEDLQEMRIRQDDLDFVFDYLDSLESKGTSGQQIEQARTLLGSLDVHDNE